MNKVKQYKGFLIDLDGTIYRGNEIIEGAIDFVNYLNERKLPYLFVTNNSSKTEAQVVKHLAAIGIHTEEANILTSSLATAKYIKRELDAEKIFVIGEEGLHTALKDEGLTITEAEANVVVVGLDRQLSYEKLTKACLNIQSGAHFVSTNKDAAIPTARGFELGNGAITAAIAKSTGCEPTFIGKPERIIMDEAVRIIGEKREDLLMIGDNYDTDIQAGIQASIDTLMVYTGVTAIDDYEQLPVKPTYAMGNLVDFLQHLNK